MLKQIHWMYNIYKNHNFEVELISLSENMDVKNLLNNYTYLMILCLVWLFPDAGDVFSILNE